MKTKGIVVVVCVVVGLGIAMSVGLWYVYVQTWGQDVIDKGAPGTSVPSKPKHAGKVPHSAAASPNAEPSEEQLSFYGAIEGNRYEEVAAFLHREPNLANSSPGGISPLLLACFHKYPKIVALLLVSGANPNGPDMRGAQPPLIACAGVDCAECAQLLLKAGADTLRKSYDGRTALEVAKRTKHADIVSLLTHGHRS